MTKKAVMILMVVFWMMPAGAGAFVTHVTGINAGQVVSSATQTIIPAALKAVDLATGAQGVRWVALTATRANAANIAATVLFVGATVGISYLGDKFQAYLASHNPTRRYNPTTNVVEEWHESFTSIPGYTFPIGNPNTLDGYYTTSSLAYNAIAAAHPQGTPGSYPWRVSGPSALSGIPGYTGGYYVQMQMSTNPNTYAFFWVVYGPTAPPSNGSYVTVPIDTVKNDLSADVGTGAALPLSVQMQAFKAIEDAYNNVAAKLTQANTRWQEIQDMLDALITTELAALVGAEVDPDLNNAAQTGNPANSTGPSISDIRTGVRQALQDQDLSKSSIEDAVKTAVNDDTGVTEPVDPTIEVPEKKSLTAVMTTFMASLNALPIMDTLRGINLSLTGQTSTICMNLPSGLGGNKCWNASTWEGPLNMFGTGMLSMVTVMSIIGVFRG